MSANIQFYHLTTTPIERALPKLMEKAIASGMNVVVKADEAQVELLDKMLWTYSSPAFLPHGTHKDSQPERQPIYITPRDENPNGAELLVLTQGETYSGNGFKRIFDIFDGTDEKLLQQARARWKTYKDAGHDLTYIRQKDDGGWEKQAEHKAA